MLSFVTSLRARFLAKDWGYHVWMLERALTSILAQTSDKVHAVVACHDVPETPLSKDPRVRFLPVKFPPPERNNDDMCADKVLKLTVGVEWAIAQGAEYVAFVDADDLVSNRIGAFVEDHYGGVGWYCRETMFYTYGGFLLRFFKVRGRHSGPFAIIRTNLLSFDSPPFSGAWAELIKQFGESRYLEFLARRGEKVNTLVAVGLSNYRDFMAGQGQGLVPLPFPPMVMINHIESTSHVAGGIGSYHHGASGLPRWRSFASKVKQRIKWLPTLRVMTPAMRREFSIPADNEIPTRYRGGSSIFWR